MPTEAAALSISSATSAERETIATWLDGISLVVAPIRWANCRSASGGIAYADFMIASLRGRIFR
ncbi:MAG TPA: hypothetical protein VFT76_03100 [Actinomycetota bacterium]|nr:hypothetical protein [Actinomycetota bacterium]